MNLSSVYALVLIIAILVVLRYDDVKKFFEVWKNGKGNVKANRHPSHVDCTQDHSGLHATTGCKNNYGFDPYNINYQ